MSESPAQSLLEHQAGERAPQTSKSGAELNGAHATAQASSADAQGQPRPALRPKQAALWTLRNLGPRRLSAVYLWVLFFVIFSAIDPNTFPTSVTFRLVFSQGVVTCILALAFLVPLAAGAYDLSIGAVMSLSLALCIWFNLHTHIAAGLAAVIAILACTFVGAVSGFVVVKLRVNSFIATLGMSQVLLAAVLFISNNSQLVGNLPNSYTNLGQNNIAGIPAVLVYLLVLALVMWFVLEHTPVGRYLFATGGNEQATRLTGVRTDRIVWGSLIASGAIAGLAGVIYSMRTPIFTSDVGPGYLFPAVAAVFLGASQFRQRPNVWGTLIAYFALAFGIQGLALSSSTGAVWSQPLFEGVALIIAVAFASRPVVAKLRGRAADPPPAAEQPADAGAQ
jgi:ribose transport system permease protein